MAALEIEQGREFDPGSFAGFLAAQPDLGTKWAPRYVRIVTALPVTATDKVDKKPLRREKWNTVDPLWRRVGRDDVFVPMTEADVAVLLARFTATGRLDLLGP
jgi:fatty-acyl-CoA synthase